MSYNVGALDTLVEQFERIPGIGHKSAQRMAFYVLNLPEEDAKKFADSILGARQKIHQCKKCCNLTEDEYCSICSNEARDQTVVCVVEDPRDVDASPMSGIGPDQLTIKELLARLDGVQEVIMATNPTVEGEATAMYLSRLLKPMGIRTTRLAYGVPVGATLEYADETTLARAMEGRREI